MNTNQRLALCVAVAFLTFLLGAAMMSWPVVVDAVPGAAGARLLSEPLNHGVSSIEVSDDEGAAGNAICTDAAIPPVVRHPVAYVDSVDACMRQAVFLGAATAEAVTPEQFVDLSNAVALGISSTDRRLKQLSAGVDASRYAFGWLLQARCAAAGARARAQALQDARFVVVDAANVGRVARLQRTFRDVEFVYMRPVGAKQVVLLVDRGAKTEVGILRSQYDCWLAESEK